MTQTDVFIPFNFLKFRCAIRLQKIYQWEIRTISYSLQCVINKNAYV